MCVRVRARAKEKKGDPYSESLDSETGILEKRRRSCNTVRTRFRKFNSRYIDSTCVCDRRSSDRSRSIENCERMFSNTRITLSICSIVYIGITPPTSVRTPVCIFTPCVLYLRNYDERAPIGAIFHDFPAVRYTVQQNFTFDLCLKLQFSYFLWPKIMEKRYKKA